MAVCQFSLANNGWSQLPSRNSPPGRRNFAADSTSGGQTIFWGGSSDFLTGFGNSLTWHTDVAIWDPLNGWYPSVSPFSGTARANASLTQLRDTNGRLTVLGGTVIDNSTEADMVTNFPLANMTDIVLYDPRTPTGQIPPQRKHHSATLHPDGKTIIVFGGEAFNATSSFCLNDVALLDTQTWVWRIPNITGNALYRSNHTAMVIGNQLWLIAGSNQTSKAVDIQILDLDTWQFTYDFKGVGAPFESLGGVKGLVGLIIGLVVALLLAAGALWWWLRKRDNSRKEQFVETDDGVWHTSDDYLPPMRDDDRDPSRTSFSRYTNMSLDQAKYNEPSAQQWDTVPPYMDSRERAPNFLLLPLQTQKPNLAGADTHEVSYAGSHTNATFPPSTPSSGH
ncbi:hypothetical protein EC973_001370 [Apophysomyces ossiformis]|uniref:Galactose oxidase n=1 Tax=Apophysomyces ossiformis TaxID=679940 RepID=A0A8H7BRQ4_9FUNG|nr:hypothetical protein EC973_001370 [Apophysomyces ossiformis]